MPACARLCNDTQPRRPVLARRMALAASVATLMVASLLSGCETVSALVSSKPKPPPPTLIEARLVGAAQLNPDARKRPSPVVVRVYELKSRALFDATDFISLFERDKELLGAELLHREEFVMRPGEARDLKRAPGPDAAYFAVLVGFRDTDKARPRAVIAVLPHTTNRFLVKLDALAVAVLPAPADLPPLPSPADVKPAAASALKSGIKP